MGEVSLRFSSGEGLKVNSKYKLWGGGMYVGVTAVFSGLNVSSKG